jgi:hypothetical protein
MLSVSNTIDSLQYRRRCQAHLTLRPTSAWRFHHHQSNHKSFRSPTIHKRAKPEAKITTKSLLAGSIDGRVGIIEEKKVVDFDTGDNSGLVIGTRGEEVEGDGDVTGLENIGELRKNSGGRCSGVGLRRRGRPGEDGMNDRVPVHFVILAVEGPFGRLGNAEGSGGEVNGEEIVVAAVDDGGEAGRWDVDVGGTEGSGEVGNVGDEVSEILNFFEEGVDTSNLGREGEIAV